jgi:hypothetical protein
MGADRYVSVVNLLPPAQTREKALQANGEACLASFSRTREAVLGEKAGCGRLAEKPRPR